jgi:hypothetical protein
MWLKYYEEIENMERDKLKDLKKELVKSGYSNNTVEEIVNWYR